MDNVFSLTLLSEKINLQIDLITNDAKEALDFNRTMLVSLPNGEEFECTKNDINIIHEENTIDFPQ